MPLSRRDFVRTAVVGSLAASFGSTLRANPLGLPIGSQTYPHRAMIKEGNFPGLLKLLGEIGVQRIELCSPGYAEFASLSDGKQAKKIIADSGLGCESAHFSMRELRESQGKAIEWAKDVGITQMITATLGAGNAPTMDDVKKAADEYNQIAAVAAKAGIQQGLHNEGFEMTEVDGRRTYDILFELLDPKLVKFQFQMSTIGRGFVAHEYFTKYPGRFISMHLQDVDLQRDAAAPAAGADGPRRRAGPRRPDFGRQRQHRLGQDVPGRQHRRREELLRRAEHGSDQGERGVPQDTQGMSACVTDGVPRSLTPTPGCYIVSLFTLLSRLRREYGYPAGTLVERVRPAHHPRHCTPGTRQGVRADRRGQSDRHRQRSERRGHSRRDRHCHQSGHERGLYRPVQRGRQLHDYVAASWTLRRQG